MSSLATALLQDVVWKDGGFRLAAREDQPKRVIHKDVPKILRPAIETNNQLRYSCDNLQPMLARAIDRKTILMEQKMRTRIKAASDQHQVLTDTVAKLDRELERNRVLSHISAEIELTTRQTETLERQYEGLLARFQYYQGNAVQRKEEVEVMRKELKRVSRENLALSLKTKQGSQTLATTVTGFSLSCPETPKPRRKDPAKTLRSSIASVRGEARDFTSLQATFFMQEISCEQFFQDCISACRREFLRLEQLPKASKGLKDSLYFQMLPRLRSHARSQSQMETRNIDDVKYATVRQIIDTARVQAHTVSLSIPRADLAHLRPLERLGLLLANPRAIRRLHEQVFPTNVLCVRPRSPLDTERETIQIHTSRP